MHEQNTTKRCQHFRLQTSLLYQNNRGCDGTPDFKKQVYFNFRSLFSQLPSLKPNKFSALCRRSFAQNHVLAHRSLDPHPLTVSQQNWYWFWILRATSFSIASAFLVCNALKFEVCAGRTTFSPSKVDGTSATISPWTLLHLENLSHSAEYIKSPKPDAILQFRCFIAATKSAGRALSSGIR